MTAQTRSPRASPSGTLVVDAVIPALDEEGAIGDVVRRLAPFVRRIVVADNGSRDRTAERAREAGAVVVLEPRRGYGAACLRALASLRADPPDAVLFVDGDGSDVPEEAPLLIAPLARGEADFVVGSRVRGRRERGALTLPQRVGNALACHALRLRHGVPATDLGPFRAIRWRTLEALGMRDRDFGWTIEMQLRAARAKVPTVEVAVSYRRRATGESKVSGSVRGSVSAGAKILALLARDGLRDGLDLARRRRRAPLEID